VAQANQLPKTVLDLLNPWIFISGSLLFDRFRDITVSAKNKPPRGG